jgi:DinB family protein
METVMDYRFDTAIPVLERTPGVMAALLGGLPDVWLEAREGDQKWTAREVLSHLIHGERTDWMPRVEHLLAHGDKVAFPPFDQDASIREGGGQPIPALLETFASLRRQSLTRLRDLKLGQADLARTGRHPEFGVVTLGQHLATWVAHDLGHIAQVVRVMSRQYKEAVGPWVAYLSLLRSE